MNHLLSANRMRIQKSKFFWFEMQMALVFGSFCMIVNIDSILLSARTPYHSPTPLLFEGFTLTAVFCPVFCSLFLGSDYSDGTLRNKILAGHSRSSIYLANFISVFLANLLIALVSTLMQLLPTLLLGYSPEQPGRLLLFYLCGLLNMAAFSGLFTLIGMLVASKTTAVVSCLGTYFVLSTITQWVRPASMRGRSNPAVPRSLEPYTFLYDFLPTGQKFQITRMYDFPKELAPDLSRIALYALLFTAITLICGVALFQKKDLK